MAEQDSTPSVGGFDLLSNMLTGSTLNEDGRASVNEPPIVDPDLVKKALSDDDDTKDDTTKNTDTDDTKSTDDTVDDDTSDTSGDSTDDSKNTGDDNTDDTADTTDGDKPDLTEYEEDITGFLNDKFSEELGWKLEDEDAPKTIPEFVEFMKGVVAEASKPNYSSDEVKAFDEFVKQGGNMRDFYSTAIDGKIDTETVNMDNSFDQKLVLKEHYGNQGYGEERISKMLKRYEDAGVLEEEAEDALELLKNYNEKTQQKLLANQKKDSDLAQEQQQNFVNAVEDNIKNLDNVRGVKISDSDKKELLEYILVPDAEGFTKYQREYMSDIKNLLESAYFTKKGDVLINKSKAQGKSDAVKNLHDKLKANKGNKAKQSGTQNSAKSSSGLSVLGSMLQGS